MSITLSCQSNDGKLLSATFLPQKGMTLVSYKKGEVEIIDQSTLHEFEIRNAGLGVLIGPHFHHRNPAILPKIADESLFPHIARVKALGIEDPFSHGVARYAPWQVTATETSISGTLTGKDLWNGVPLSSLEGQNFTMHYRAKIAPEGLIINLDIVSDTDSLVGLHYYYHLPNGKGKIIADVQPNYLSKEGKKVLEADWKPNYEHEMVFDLEQAADFTFFPYPNRSEGKMVLDVEEYKLITTYKSPSQENSWQLYHPKGASFVCVEPISSQDPHHPNLSVSSLQISLEIV